MADQLPKFEELEELPEFGELEEITAVQPTPEVPRGQAILGGLTTGATLGFREELAGGLEAAGQAVGVKGLGAPTFGEVGLQAPVGFDKEELLRIYRERKQAEIERQAAEKEAHPGAFLAAEVAGGLALPVPGAAALRGAKTAGEAVKGAAKVGAVTGGIAGLGTSEADLTRGEIGEAAADIATGAAIGGTAGLVLGAAGQKLKTFGQSKSLREAGEKRLLSAVTPPKKIIEKEILTKKDGLKGIGKALSGDFVDEAGKSKPIFTIGAKPDEVLQNIEKALEQQGRKIQPLFAKAQEKIDQVVPKLKLLEAKNKSSIFEELENLARRKHNQLIKAGEVDQANNLKKFSDELLLQNMDELESFNLNRLNEFKQLIGQRLSEKDWSPTATDPLNVAKRDLSKTMYGAVKQRIQNLADKASGPGQKLGEEIKDMNAKYSNLLDAKLAATYDVVRSMAPGGLGFKDMVVPAMAGGAAANPLVGIATLGGIKLLEKKTGRKLGRLVDLITGKGLNRMAKVVEGLDASKAAPILNQLKKIEKLPVASRAGALGLLVKNNPEVFEAQEKSTDDKYKLAEDSLDVINSSANEISGLVNELEVIDHPSYNSFINPLIEASKAKESRRKSIMWGLTQQPAFNEMIEAIRKENK